MLSENPNLDQQNKSVNQDQDLAVQLELYRELERLEAIILDSPRIPLLGLIVASEEDLLAQIEAIRHKIPDTLIKALEILKNNQKIIEEAKYTAAEIIASAQAQAEEILERTGIIQQAESQAHQIWTKIERNCQDLKEQTLMEITDMQTLAQEEVNRWRAQAQAECEEIQAGADAYADSVLENLEEHTKDILQVIRNGRQQLQDKE